MRKPRPGEVTCRCSAYAFPHRFSGGRCHGVVVVQDTWERNYGSNECGECNLVDRSNGYLACQVLEGQERPSECLVWQEYIRSEEVRVLGPYWRSTKI